MYFVDPLYLVVMLACVAISMVAQLWVMSAVRSQERIFLRSGLSGAQIAQMLLVRSGLPGLRIERAHGFLGDHYDPTTRTLRLSDATYDGRTVASAGIAAHEAGHALQHAGRYWPMRVRQTLVPAANIGTQIGVLLIMLGLAFGALGIAKIGVLVFAGFVAFAIVTLPVEIDASRRAARELLSSGALAPDEVAGVRRVLRAAAGTYLAAALTALLQLFYFVLRVRGDSRRRG